MHHHFVSVGSMIVAALALFVGPYVSLRVARRQNETALAVAYKQVIAQMRQKWIDDLRERVSEIVSVAVLVLPKTRD
jgi:predicted membrane protein